MGGEDQIAGLYQKEKVKMQLAGKGKGGHFMRL